MSFSINTNVASLQAQNYLRVNSDFQGKTINRVTSGLRIVSSGDDAAGLAIANGYRSDEAVLTQGVRNANDGLSQLQIMDGGISNISMLLDRARTLATQSASGTFTGDRSVVNGEFQSVLSEIDRQAQSIGLDTGGIFAKSLSVFMGGGKANNGTSVIANGSVAVDLSKSTVDTKSLGLKGSPAENANAYSLANNSTTSAALVVANNGTGSGSAIYNFEGPGFSDANAVTVTVSNSGITDTNTLLAAINRQIGIVANGGTAADTAFKNAGITAQIITDSNGNQKLAFASSNAAFQVEAGNAAANAFMGNFVTGSATGAAMTSSVKGAGALVDNGATGETLQFEIRGAGMNSPLTFTVNHVGGGSSILAELAANFNFAVVGGFTATQSADGKLQINNPTNGESFTVAVAGDVHNYTGLSTAIAGGGAGTSASYTTITAGAAAGTVSTGGGDVYAFNISIGGGPNVELIATPGNNGAAGAAAAAELQRVLNLAINDGSHQALVDAGLQVTVGTGGSANKLIFTSTNGSNFQLGVNTTDTVEAANHDAGFGTFGAASLTANTVVPVTLAPSFSSGSVQQSSMFAFSGLKYSTDTQAITISAQDSNGVTQSAVVTLGYSTGRTIDDAVAAINTQLQATNNPLLASIVAQKVNNPNATPANSEAILLQSSQAAFTTALAAGGHSNGLNLAGSQSIANNSTAAAGGSTVDIGTQTGAQNAVNALATAVSSLGSAQAVVGRGQNQFGYAINLAQSQLTNLTTAESRIRDADLASEAANLTKAQILLQAGVAALAQANAAPQAVLSLLKG